MFIREINNNTSIPLFHEQRRAHTTTIAMNKLFDSGCNRGLISLAVSQLHIHHPQYSTLKDVENQK